MPQRTLLRVGLAATGLGLVGLALVWTASPPVVAEGSGAEVRALGGFILIVAAAAAAVALMNVEPAWPLSLGLAAEMFSGNWDLLGAPVPVDRALIAVGLLSVLLRARTSTDVFGGPPKLVHGVIAGAALYAISSAVLAGTIDDRDAQFALVDRFGLLPFALFCIAPAVFRTERQRRILLGTLAGMGAYLAYVALMQRLGPDALVFPGYITDPTVGIHVDRSRGPFIEAVANGIALFQCGVAAGILAAVAADRRVRAAATLVAAGCVLGIVFTLTRSVWLSSAGALLVTFLSMRELRRFVVPVGVGAAILVLGALAIVPGLQRDVDARQDDKLPIWDRRNSNAAALRMLADRPLVGFGWFTFATHSSEYMRLGPGYPLTRVGLQEHNVYLSHAVELGLVGLLLWGAAVALAIGGAILRRGPPEMRPWRIGLIAVATQYLLVANFVPLGYALPTATLWLWAGVVYGRTR